MGSFLGKVDDHSKIVHCFVCVIFNKVSAFAEETSFFKSGQWTAVRLLLLRLGLSVGRTGVLNRLYWRYMIRWEAYPTLALT